MARARLGAQAALLERRASPQSARLFTPAACQRDGFTVTGLAAQLGGNQEVCRPHQEARHHPVPQHLQQVEGSPERRVEMGRRGENAMAMCM